MTRILTLISVLLLAIQAVAGGLYDEIQTPIAGEVVSYRRMPAATISNPLNVPPSIEMTTETVELYPNGKTLKTFFRRVNAGYMDFYGKKYPLYNPSTGVQIDTTDADAFYAMAYSLWILAERKADGQQGFLASEPNTICYTTNGADPACILPAATVPE